ncbi:chromosome segregation protein, putative [Babesia caballi]|uniref:Chromosome segregation protein, putative n=1 Tax=Babesia caballi TaxID=5871 RepID=A0AAV4LYW7_BABCB|nr:chromosome segregation protein, putative [Babesia caballi]
MARVWLQGQSQGQDGRHTTSHAVNERTVEKCFGDIGLPTALDEAKMACVTISTQLVCKALEERCAEKRAAIAVLRDKRRELGKKIDEVEADLADWNRNRAQKEAEAKAQLRLLKAEIKRDSQALDRKNQAMSAVQLEQDHLRRRVATAEEELQQREAAAGALCQKIADMEGQLVDRHRDLAFHEAQLAEITRQVCASQEELGRMQRELEASGHAKAQMTLRLKKLEYALQEVEKDAQDALLAADRLVRDHAWLPAEEPNFNRPGSAFDFTNIRIETVAKRLVELQQLRHELARRVNRRAQQLYDKMEGDYRDLLRKKRQVEEDRDKIHSVIAELDVKKHENINDIFRTVTRYFADIFHVLLSNAEAKLVPVGGDIVNGIEMRVGFNGAWKSSLAEFSGGQRSLLALSLILAMLKVRPAPIYILDEVDAALDLSHTQNIGKMIKTQFPNSQFLIVSLKEGMFSNASVLFRTRFVDGSSTIVRHSLADKDAAKKHKEVEC